MILYNSEDNIRDQRPFFRPLFCHNSVVKHSGVGAQSAAPGPSRKGCPLVRAVV